MERLTGFQKHLANGKLTLHTSCQQPDPSHSTERAIGSRFCRAHPCHTPLVYVPCNVAGIASDEGENEFVRRHFPDTRGTAFVNASLR